MEQELFELDMERQYEDESFALDQVNLELQQATQEHMDAAIEAAYDEYVDEIMSMYHNPEYWDNSEY